MDLLKLNKRSKTITIASIVMTVVLLIFFIVGAVLEAQSITRYGYWGTPVVDEGKQTAATAMYVIGGLILAGYGIYCFVMSIMIIISSAALDTSPNKTLYLVMAILGMFLLGIISYIVIWVKSSKELQNSNSTNIPNTTVPNNPTTPNTPNASY